MTTMFMRKQRWLMLGMALLLAFSGWLPLIPVAGACDSPACEGTEEAPCFQACCVLAAVVPAGSFLQLEETGSGSTAAPMMRYSRLSFADIFRPPIG